MLKICNTRPEDVPLVEFMYLELTRMPGVTHHRRLRSLLLYLCYVSSAHYLPGEMILTGNGLTHQL